MHNSTIATIQARQQAYNHKLTAGGIISSIGLYVLLFFLLTWVLYRNIWVALIVGVVMSYYAFYSIYQREVAVRYYREGLSQRDVCVATMVQALTNPSNTIRDALAITVPRLKGEFRREMSILLTAIVDGEDQFDLHQIFVHIELKYSEDVVFQQFMEQVETALHEGNLDPLVFRMLRTHHRLNYMAQLKYIHKRKYRREMDFLFIWLSSGLMMFDTYLPSILSIGGGTGTKGATNLHAVFENFIGWIIAFLAIFFMFLILDYFLKIYYDESVTTIRHR